MWCYQYSDWHDVHTTATTITIRLNVLGWYFFLQKVNNSLRGELVWNTITIHLNVLTFFSYKRCRTHWDESLCGIQYSKYNHDTLKRVRLIFCLYKRWRTHWEESLCGIVARGRGVRLIPLAPTDSPGTGGGLKHIVTALLHWSETHSHSIVTLVWNTHSQHCYIGLKHTVTAFLHWSETHTHSIVTMGWNTQSQHCYTGLIHSHSIVTPVRNTVTSLSIGLK